MTTNIIDFQVTTPPALEPVTVQEVKSLLRLDFGTDDAMIASLITDAREWLEGKVWRGFITQTCTAVLSLGGAPQGKVSGIVGEIGYPLELPYALPLQSVTSVQIEIQVEDWFTLTQGQPDQSLGDWLADMDSEPGRVWLSVAAFSQWSPSISYPAPKGALPRFKVVYVVGYGSTAASVPAGIKQAIRNVAAWMYDNRAQEPPDDLVPRRWRYLAI